MVGVLPIWIVQVNVSRIDRFHFSVTLRLFPAHSSVIFSMFCIKIYKNILKKKFKKKKGGKNIPRAKIWERQSVCWLKYRETKMSNTCLINTGSPDNNDLQNTLNGQLYKFYNLDYRILMTSHANNLQALCQRETLNFTFHIGSTPTFLYFDL